MPPLRMHDGNMKNMWEVLYVLSIIKNLASMGQMVEWGLQVRLNEQGYFVENFKHGCCKLIAKGNQLAKGKKEGKLFKLGMQVF